MTNDCELMSTKEVALLLFGNERVGTRQRIIRTILNGWLTGHQVEGQKNSPYYISRTSFESYREAVQKGGSALAELKREPHASL